MEMQALLAEIVEKFEFSLPAEKCVVKRAPTSLGMIPMIEGKEAVGAAMPLQVSLIQQ